MSELISFVLALLPAMAFVALIVATVRAASAPGAVPPVDLLHRSYGA
jgi:hypothetical protein